MAKNNMIAIDERFDELKRFVRTSIAKSNWRDDDIKDKRSLPELIADERSSRKMSFDELAKEAGISKAHVFEIEKGNCVNPTVSSLYKLSRALGIPFLILCNAAIRDMEIDV